MNPRFRNRREAGQQLSAKLQQYAGRPDVIVLALPRGGVPVAFEADQPDTSGLPLGLFGASTGGGAALVAATKRPARVGAVVSRGGRPDLADEALPLVEAPTLLLVGERDEFVIELNEHARARMRADVRL